MSTATITMAAHHSATGAGAAQGNTARSQATAPKAKLKLTARGRRVFTGLAALPLVVVAVAFALNGGMATASTGLSTTPVETVTVEAGQSLWQLAEEIAPEADPRDVIDEVVSFNQLSSVEIQPGQQLDIPTIYSN